MFVNMLGLNRMPVCSVDVQIWQIRCHASGPRKCRSIGRKGIQLSWSGDDGTVLCTVYARNIFFGGVGEAVGCVRDGKNGGESNNLC